MNSLLSLWIDEHAQAFCAYRLFPQQRNDRIALGMTAGHGVDLAQFVGSALAQQRRLGSSKVCPVGAVSITTNCLPASRMMWENA